jgi:uncharacterized protein (TIGR01777 family)
MLERIVVTGGTGFVGQTLVKALAPGREIVVLTRGGALPPELAALGTVRGVSWDAKTIGAWASEIDGAAGVIHLAGSQAVGVRWTKRVKQRLFDSRVRSADVLVEAIRLAPSRPRVLVSTSGTDYYAGRLTDEPVDESGPPGTGFLSRLCVDWEGAIRAADSLGVRTVSARLGLVVGRSKPFRLMTLPFRLFVGGPLGSGCQVFSWVHVDDVATALRRCLEDPALSGPINVCAPEALPHKEFARRLGRALHRPSWLPTPAFALRLIFGEGADPMLYGRRVVSKRLEEIGFRFAYPSLDPALADAVGA